MTNRKRKPARGGVNDAPVCLSVTLALLVALGIGSTLPCTSGQCVRTPAEQARLHPAPVDFYRADGTIITPARLADFDRAVRVVLANEGGYVPVDANTGKPAMFGIGAKYFPAAYAEAKRLTAQHGESAGRAYAAEFYKREFWDRYGIESLPPEAQVVVFDGVVNHRADFAKRLVQAARDGASATRLLVMRWEEYRRLAQSQEYAAYLEGWTARLERTARATQG